MTTQVLHKMTTQVLHKFLRIGLLLAAASVLGRVHADGGGETTTSPSVLTNAIFWLDAADMRIIPLRIL